MEATLSAQENPGTPSPALVMVPHSLFIRLFVFSFVDCFLEDSHAL